MGILTVFYPNLESTRKINKPVLEEPKVMSGEYYGGNLRVEIQAMAQPFTTWLGDKSDF